MIALQSMDQAAGNNWSNRPRPMLHELISVEPIHNLDFAFSNSMFDDMERQMRASEAELDDSIQLLREKYVFNNPEAVKFFLKAHRSVPPLLIEAAPQLAAAFGNCAPLALEVMLDDETQHSIYALAIWNRDGAEARSALRKFDQGWLASNLQAIDGRIVFDYELV